MPFPDRRLLKLLFSFPLQHYRSYRIQGKFIYQILQGKLAWKVRKMRKPKQLGENAALSLFSLGFRRVAGYS